MAHADLIEQDWGAVVTRLGGAELLEVEGRESKAFQRARGVKCAVDLLRFVLAYAHGKLGLRLTAAWADGIGLASISNVALLGRLRNAAPFLERIAARLMAEHATQRDRSGIGAAKGRPIRIVDATNVVKAGRSERESGGVWRIHAVYDLPHERLSAFEITDEKGAEAIDRIPVVPGEIRIADRVHCHVEKLAVVTAQGGDVIVRATWRSARWLDAGGRALEIVDTLRNATSDVIDRPIQLARHDAPPLAMRLVAIRLPKEMATKAVATARAAATHKGYKLSGKTLIAAEWVILVTSLSPSEFSAEEVSSLYRLRWRIEMAFKRMKSLVGLRAPPGKCPLAAKAWVLCHLIVVLLTEALVDAVGDSPRRAAALVPACGAPQAC